MSRLERGSVEAETPLDKVKNFALKILGIGALIGVGYVALKEVVIPYLAKQMGKLKPL
jgi:hypothetical protein